MILDVAVTTSQVSQHSTALHFSLYFGTSRTEFETSACESGFSQFCLFDQPSAEPPKQG